MSKVLYQIPEFLSKQLERLGYRRITAAAQRIFNPYYDAMNEHWPSDISFLCKLAWDETLHTFYKPVADMLVCLEYDTASGVLTAVPFLGRYAPEAIADVFRVLRADVEALRVPLVIADVSPWMLPFYQGLGVPWEVSDERALSDYIYQRGDFAASMNRPDTRYRYRYFVRRFAPETVELTRAHRAECADFMREYWCPTLDCAACYGCPMRAVDRVIGGFDSLRADGLLVRVDGKTAGFCVVSCRNGMGLYLFKHTNNRLKGINEYLLRECFTRFLGEAGEINYTEDMGIESLRTYKSKLAPYTLLPKFKLAQPQPPSVIQISGLLTPHYEKQKPVLESYANLCQG